MHGPEWESGGWQMLGGCIFGAQTPCFAKDSEPDKDQSRVL